MRKTFLLLLVTVSSAMLLVSCGPSKEEKEDLAKYEEYQRQQARTRASAPHKTAIVEAVEKMEADTEESFRRFMATWADNTNPRAYETAIEGFAADGPRFVITLSIDDKDEALSLCNFALSGWVAVGGHSAQSIKVVHLDGTVLAQSEELPTGSHVCR
jgi:hypothetical protein